MNQQTTPAARNAASLPDRSAPPYTDSGDGRREPVTGAGTMEGGARAGRRREPGRAERTPTALLAALLGSVIVGFVTIGGQLLSMQRQMHEDNRALREEVHQEVSGLREEMHEEIGALRDEMRTEMGKLSDRITRIETFLQIHHGPLPGP